MKNNYKRNKHQVRFLSLPVMLSVFLLTLFSVRDVKAQCNGGTYCTNIVATNNATYNMGISNVKLGYGPSNFLINNSTSSGSGTQIYFDYTNMVDTAYAGSTVYYSITVGTGNSSIFRIYVDWDNNGTFSTSSPELEYTSANIAAGSAAVTGNFVVPAATPGGVYRVRIASDYGYATAPGPCGPLQYSAEFEDYTLIVPGATLDVVSNAITLPAQFVAGNNNISFKFYNISSTTITSIGIAYQLDANPVVTQALTGLSIGPATSYTAAFSTPLTLSAIGTYGLKIWTDAPNGGGNASPQNDTLCRTIVISCTGPLAAGTYTIDPNGSGSSNFPRFGIVDTILNVCGILGPVVFNVAPGTYVEQVDIKPVSNVSPSVGSSAVNTVTFDGGADSASTHIIQWNATTATDAHTVRFNGCSYINFRNMTIKGLNATNALGVHFMGSPAFINLKKCSIIVASNSTSANVRQININNSNAAGNGGQCGGTQGNVHDIYVDSNYLSGGYHGIYMTSSGGNNNFRWNTMENVYQWGFSFASAITFNILYNTIKMSASNTNSQGIYQCNGGGGTKCFMVGNTISASNNGIATLSGNWVSGTTIAYNYFKPVFTNTAAGPNGNATAIWIPYNGSGLIIQNNTILMNQANGSGITDGANGSVSGLIIKNNLIVLQSATSAGYAISTLGGMVATCDYNTCFTKNPSHDLAQINGNNTNTTNFIGANGFNIHSSIDDPLLTNYPTDIVPHAICQKGIAAAINITGAGNGLLTKDYYGVTFSNPPQVGASEAGGGYAVDAALAKFVLPVPFPVSPGAQDVAVRVKNAGSTTITSFSVSVQLGATTNTIFWSGSLAPCTDTLITFTGSNQFTLVTGSNVLKAWTSSPNFAVDSNAFNDTLSNTFCTVLVGGTYLIDSAGNGDYLNFSQVATALSCGGISGPVIFNVRKATYVEQPMYLTVQGASATNNITFQSEAGHADSVVLQYNSTSSTANWVLNLNGSNFFKFRNMTISALNAANGVAMTFGNNATSDSFYNVVFKGTSSTSNTTNRALVSQPSQSNISNWMYFDTCRFINGAFGTYINSSSNSAVGQSSQNLSINNCDFINQYAYGIYNQYLCGLKLTKNRITTNSTNTNYYAMYNFWIMSVAAINKPVITGNTINGGAGGAGMYNWYFGVNSTVTSTNRALIANNTINIGSGSNSTFGIYEGYSTGPDYINNTVKIGTSQNSNSSAAFYNATTCCYTINSVLNNVFAGTNGAPAVRLDDATYTASFNYNNLYSTGPNLAYLNATAKANLPLWRTASNRDLNSTSYKPGFTSATDVTPNPADTASWSLNGRGIHTALITTDILGNARPLTLATGVPDIGAFEFTPTVTPPMCTSDKVAPVAGDSQYFFFSFDTVARITWDPSFTPPSDIAVMQYSGVKPDHIGSAPNYMYFYTALTGPTGYYAYKLDLNYRNTWLGTMSSASNLRMAEYSTTTSPNWKEGTGSTVNTSKSIISYNNPGTDLLVYSGSDATSPLPVTLFDLSANRIKNDVVVNWSTVSEINSSLFTVERSFDGRQFAYAGDVKAAGKSNALVSYSYPDKNVISLASGNVIYYRLKMIDRDGKFEYSKTVTVRLDKKLDDVTVTMYPNPVSNNLYVKVNLPSSGNVKIELMDITGKTLMSKTQWMEAGSNLSNENLGSLSSGVYFISTEINGERQVQKLIKE